MTTTPTNISTATEVEAKPCPVCKRSGSAACSLCRGSSSDHREYSDCSVVDDDAWEAWQQATNALTTFEQQHGIGGGT